MPTSEKTNTFYDKERSKEQEIPQGDSLREALLAAPEWKGAYITLPRGTVMIEANTSTMQPELFADLLPEVVAEINEDRYKFMSTIREDGQGKIVGPIQMAVMDRMNRNGGIKKDTLPSDMTLLYDGEREPVEGEVQLPSAILIHKRMSPEEVAELRTRLPRDIPLIDASTNMLLDEVGAVEREKARADEAGKRKLGNFALHNFGELYGVQSEGFEQMLGNTQRRMFDEEQEAFRRRGGSLHTVYPGTEENENMTGHTPRSGAPGSSEERRAPREETRDERSRPTPEHSRPEPRSYREKTSTEQAEIDAYEENRARGVQKAVDTILTEAKERYGASDLSGLDDDQLRKVQRGVQSKLHPDRGYDNGGDQAAFQESGVLMDKFRHMRDEMRQQEASTAPNEETSDNVTHASFGDTQDDTEMPKAA